MKKLQNNFSTPEQSKRLLEFGVPADSADCYYSNNGIRRLRSECWMLKPNFFVEYSYNTPCWSVGRLIEIYIALSSHEYVSLIFKKTFTPLDKILDKFEKDAKNGLFDFSKLED